MHVHAKPPVLLPNVQAPASKPVKRPAAGASSDVGLLAQLGQDRGGSGSRPQRRPDERAEDRDTAGTAAGSPASTLAVLLANLGLDAIS